MTHYIIDKPTLRISFNITKKILKNVVLLIVLLFSELSISQTDDDLFSQLLKQHAQALKNGDNDDEPFLSGLTALADKNHRESQYMIGVLVFSGLSTPKESIKRLNQAETNGCSGAAGILGILYLQGEFVKKNEKIGLSWLRNAAERGDVNAQMMLGSFYYHGSMSLDKDLIQAYSWLYQAKLLVSPVTVPALNMLILIREKLTQEQIASAEKQAKDRLYKIGGIKNNFCAHSTPM